MHFKKQYKYTVKCLPATPPCVLLLNFAASFCFICKILRRSFSGSQDDLIFKLVKEAFFSNRAKRC